MFRSSRDEYMRNGAWKYLEEICTAGGLAQLHGHWIMALMIIVEEVDKAKAEYMFMRQCMMISALHIWEHLRA